jgi:hypothetical protein
VRSSPREKGSAIVEEGIDGKNCVFDNNGCALIFRRRRTVLGEEAIASLT